MEMVKYFAMIAVIAAPFMLADFAQARGPAGCASCQAAVYAGGCPGGVCSVQAVPGKMAVSYNSAPTVVAQPATTTAPVVTTASPAPRYYATNVRRGLFGWRR